MKHFNIFAYHDIEKKQKLLTLLSCLDMLSYRFGAKLLYS